MAAILGQSVGAAAVAVGVPFAVGTTAGAGEPGTTARRAGSAATAALRNTRTGMGGIAGPSAAKTSIPAITAVQTACRPAGDRTRKIQIAAPPKTHSAA